MTAAKKLSAGPVLELPISFSGPLVPKVLDGSKTQTRRLLRFPDWVKDQEMAVAALNAMAVDGLRPALALMKDGRPSRRFTCRYGRRGAKLWVRETWGLRGDGRKVYYAATPELGAVNIDRWRPSIHMKRWMSRITLELADLRVERLWDISEGDAIAEGWPKAGGDFETAPGNGGPFDWFRDLWDSINPPPQCSYVGKCNSSRCPLHSLDKSQRKDWDANPWVWALSFRRMTP